MSTGYFIVDGKLKRDEENGWWFIVSDEYKDQVFVASTNAEELILNQNWNEGSSVKFYVKQIHPLPKECWVEIQCPCCRRGL